MLKIAVLGVSGVILALIFRNKKEVYATVIIVGISIYIMGTMRNQFEHMLQMIREMLVQLQIENAYMTGLLKILGVSYIAEFASAICRDAGYSTISEQIELFCKITILALSLPVLQSLLEAIQSFLT